MNTDFESKHARGADGRFAQMHTPGKHSGIEIGTETAPTRQRMDRAFASLTQQMDSRTGPMLEAMKQGEVPEGPEWWLGAPLGDADTGETRIVATMCSEPTGTDWQLLETKARTRDTAGNIIEVSRQIYTDTDQGRFSWSMGIQRCAVQTPSGLLIDAWVDHWTGAETQRGVSVSRDGKESIDIDVSPEDDLMAEETADEAEALFASVAGRRIDGLSREEKDLVSWAFGKATEVGSPPQGHAGTL